MSEAQLDPDLFAQHHLELAEQLAARNSERNAIHSEITTKLPRSSSFLDHLLSVIDKQSLINYAWLLQPLQNPAVRDSQLHSFLLEDPAASTKFFVELASLLEPYIDQSITKIPAEISAVVSVVQGILWENKSFDYRRYSKDKVHPEILKATSIQLPTVLQDDRGARAQFMEVLDRLVVHQKLNERVARLAGLISESNLSQHLDARGDQSKWQNIFGQYLKMELKTFSGEKVEYSASELRFKQDESRKRVIADLRNKKSLFDPRVFQEAFAELASESEVEAFVDQLLKDEILKSFEDSLSTFSRNAWINPVIAMPIIISGIASTAAAAAEIFDFMFIPGNGLKALPYLAAFPAVAIAWIMFELSFPHQTVVQQTPNTLVPERLLSGIREIMFASEAQSEQLTPLEQDCLAAQFLADRVLAYSRNSLYTDLDEYKKMVEKSVEVIYSEDTKGTISTKLLNELSENRVKAHIMKVYVIESLLEKADSATSGEIGMIGAHLLNIMAKLSKGSGTPEYAEYEPLYQEIQDKFFIQFLELVDAALVSNSVSDIQVTVNAMEVCLPLFRGSGKVASVEYKALPESIHGLFGNRQVEHKILFVEVLHALQKLLTIRKETDQYEAMKKRLG